MLEEVKNKIENLIPEQIAENDEKWNTKDAEINKLTFRYALEVEDVEIAQAIKLQDCNLFLIDGLRDSIPPLS